MPTRCCTTKPHKGERVILFDPDTAPVHDSEIPLRFRMSAFGKRQPVTIGFYEIATLISAPALLERVSVVERRTERRSHGARNRTVPGRVAHRLGARRTRESQQ